LAATELEAPPEGAALERPRLGAARRRRVIRALRWGVLPVFWLVVAFVILAPCACFLLLAVSPRLFDQGTQWFTLAYLRDVFTGTTAVAMTNSVWVSCAAAALGVGVGAPVAWAVARTTLPGRRLVAASMWLVLLMPSWIPALGWVRLFQDHGVLDRIGVGSAFLTHAVLGPFGVVLLLGLRSVPFAFLAVSAALAGLGQEFEDAARVHGANRRQTIKVLTPILAPAVWSALAIGFAESVSDFGIAATLAYSSHFTLATYQLYAAINDFPPSFPTAAAMGWLLVGSVALPLVLQAGALRGRSYAVLSGRTRRALRRELSLRGRLLGASGVGLLFAVALVVPVFGVVSASLLGDYGSSFSVSLANYETVFHSVDLLGPLERSLAYGAITATITVVGGFVAARLLTRVKSKAVRVLDFLLLAAVALPSVVFAAGYILAYNLPILSRVGIDLYQTTTLLIIGYAASSLPTNARVLFGAVSQLQASLHEAARTHGAGPLLAWLRGVLPLVSRPLMFAWLLTFTGVFLELPISQLLYAPSAPPISVSIENDNTYHFGVGMAQATIALVCALGAVALVLGAYRLLTPRGWRLIGEAVHA
jgi:iron(III) transport system permease protein